MKKYWVNRLVPFFLIVFMFLFQPLLFAEIKPAITHLGIEKPTHVLFIGNSYFYYNDSLHNTVIRLAKAADNENEKSYKYKSATISGAYLGDHSITSFLQPGAFRFKKPFDVVILQGHSTSQTTPEKHEKFVSQVKVFDKLIKASGSKTALFMTMAYTDKHKKYNSDMIEMNRKGYLDAGNQVGAIVIPVGLAFDSAYKKKPGIKLHKDYDGSHPNKLGTYLASCVVYATLYEKSPVGNSFLMREPEIDAEMAAFLQNVAWDTVTSFLGW